MTAMLLLLAALAVLALVALGPVFLLESFVAWVNPTRHLYDGWVSVRMEGLKEFHVRRRRLTLGEKLRWLVSAPALLILQAGTFSFSTVGQQRALEAVFLKTQSPATGSVYVALATSAPTDADSVATVVGKEITTAGTNGYARQVFGPTAATSADPSEMHNTSILTFGPFSIDPGNCTHFFIIEALTGSGSPYTAWGAWGTARDAANGDSLQVAASALSISLT